VLNQPTPTDQFDFDVEEAGDVLDVTLEDFNITETSEALNSLKNNKAAGKDEATAELMKHGKDTEVNSPRGVTFIWKVGGTKIVPKKTRQYTLPDDLEAMDVSWEEAKFVAGDRKECRSLVAQCSSRNRRT